MKKIICLFMILLWGGIAFARTTVRFEPETISLGESAQLIIESDAPITQAPDLASLTGKFALAGQQQGKQTIQINGRVQVQYTLIWNVFPRQSGKLSTGKLELNGKELRPAILTVLEPSENKALPITLSAKINVSEAYPEQLVFLNLQLISGVTLLDPKMIPPTIPNARVVQLNMDKSYQALVDNQPRLVIERTYAVIPEKTGKVTIPAIEVYGSVPNMNHSGPSDLFTKGMLFNGLMGQKDIRLESKPIQLKVLPKPTDWTGWWLPAELVQLTAEDSFPEKITAGDSLTRKITLSAMGLTAEQLPLLVQGGNSSIKVYPSPEQRETTQSESGTVLGTESVTVVVVPTKAGEIRIPAVTVSWFNTRTKQTEQAVIPEKTITVQPGTQPMATPDSSAASPTAEKTASPRRNRKRAEQNGLLSGNTPLPPKTVHFWIYWTIGLTALALVGGFILGFIIFRKHHPKTYYIEEREQRRTKKKKKKSLPDLYPF